MNHFERGQFWDNTLQNRDDEVFEGKKNPRVLTESGVSQILTGDAKVVFQILGEDGKPVCVGENFVVYIIWHRSFCRYEPPIEIVHVPPLLWAAFASADGGWHHHESIHTNDLVHALIIKRFVGARRGLQEHAIRARTIMGMSLCCVYPDGTGLIEGHLADSKWQRHPFYFRARLGTASRKHSHQIFSDRLIQTMSDGTILVPGSISCAAASNKNES